MPKSQIELIATVFNQSKSHLYLQIAMNIYELWLRNEKLNQSKNKRKIIKANSFGHIKYLTLTFSTDLRYPTNINAKKNCNGREKH